MKKRLLIFHLNDQHRGRKREIELKVNNEIRSHHDLIRDADAMQANEKSSDQTTER